MEAEGREGDESTGNVAATWKEMMEGQWRKIRNHAETYPYVWASYAVVYVSFGVYLTYRWRTLRRTENRVRVLQERLRKLVEDQDAAATSGSDKPNKLSSVTPKSVPMPQKLED